ncbi:hypothetical protein [Streptomyces sp. NPDC007205]|uniref:hypothetical protein n=1 Tax=Streptomyces sp. NPDC007205 TaxID=3154316 RepID=UPI0033DD4E5C
MADEQDKWLNRGTAERLLRGESLEAVDASARDQAERLSRALGALAAEAAPATGELPGEQAALAAFRKAREATAAERAVPVPAPGRAAGTSRRAVPGADAGLIRIGARGRTGTPARGPRWGRPVRLALAAVVTAGTLGGVAMAAGSGMLRTPFGPEEHGPAASVSADATSAAPFASVPPEGTPGTTQGPGAHRGGASGEATGPDDRTGSSHAPGAGELSGTPGRRWKDAAAACRDLRDGRGLEAGRRRTLENLAGGSARVSQYCKLVLSAADLADGTKSGGKGDGSGDSGKAKGNGGGDGKTKGAGKGGGKDKGGGDDDPGRGRPGHPGQGGGGHPGKRGAGATARLGDGAGSLPAPKPTPSHHP